MHILCVEYLQAVPGEFLYATQSLRFEAAAMLNAVIDDLTQISGVSVTVLLGNGVSTRLVSSSGLQLIPVQDAEDLTDQLRTWCQKVDVLLLIAPECRSVLTDLLLDVEQHAPGTLRLLNLDSQRCRLFSDKLATFHWLKDHALPTIPTRLIDSDTSHRLVFKSDRLTAKATASPNLVIKPRFGAGSDDVRVIVSDCVTWSEVPANIDKTSMLIAQPFIPGTACSIGFLGNDAARLATILPPAQQLIRNRRGSLSYYGGQIPCDRRLRPFIEQLAPAVAQSLGGFSGYIGVDLIVDPDAEVPVRIVEVNPRLCTSYIGYRALTGENLAARLLTQCHDVPVQWNPGSINFSTTGSADGTDAPTA